MQACRGPTRIDIVAGDKTDSTVLISLAGEGVAVPSRAMWVSCSPRHQPTACSTRRENLPTA